MATTPLLLDEIPTVTLLYKLKHLSPSLTPDEQATSRYNSKISIIRHDITKLRVGAIVNAANTSLLGGGGVDGAIHRAAGPQLVAECRKLGGCRTGSAKITDAYSLPCEKVIHACGPVYGREGGDEEALLEGCYRTSLNLAEKNGCKSIAFSALSTGVYGYPSLEAAETVVQTVKDWLEEDDERADKIERIIFCQFMEKDVDAYEEIVPKYFSPAAEVEQKSVVPDLPDVPSEEPKDPDEPENKKLKVDERKD